MSGYCKLFSDIIESSIWRESAEVRVVWISILAMADADGFVRGSPGWLAMKIGISPETCAAAIKKFSEPDPSSKTPDNEGRRIEIFPDGWLILNYLAYRDRLSSDPIATATRDRVRKHRELHRKNVTGRYVTDKALRNEKSVTPRPEAEASSSAEAEAEAKAAAAQKAAAAPVRFKPYIRALKAGHVNFKAVPDMAIAQALLTQPDQSKWETAIDDLLRRYAGSHIQTPIVCLESHLAGKPPPRDNFSGKGRCDEIVNDARAKYFREHPEEKQT